ncbi:MAG: hypothetical protein Q8P18_22835 [Pseudomonadota bacterium]|nr:hypothetical protein [Pseudomonadota bacterium]
MTRSVFASVLLAAAACSRPEQPAPPPLPPAPTLAWIGDVKPWYCGTEPLPAKVRADGVATPQVRDVALKIMPGAESFTVIYAAANGPDKAVGTMTRFAVGAERTATLRWENDQKQKGDAVLAFSPDYSSVTVTWTAAVTPPGTSPVPLAPAPLAATSGASGCVAGPMIR